MAEETTNTIMEDNVGSKMDDEIATLRAQIKQLKSRRSIQVSNIMASRASESLLARLRALYPSGSSPSLSTTTPKDTNPLHQALLDRSEKQIAHNQECLYRTCAGITTFRIQDPDPFAVDHGKVLGIRIEVFTTGKFLRPYYVFLNKPYKGSPLFRVHRHTVPPCVPLAALAAKYLPTPGVGVDPLKVRKQDFPTFVKSLRREVANYHNRMAAISHLKKSLGLAAKKGNSKGKEREHGIADISADAEAKQVRLEWTDGRIGRIIVDSRGDIQNCVITGESGRDREEERRILNGKRRMEDLVAKLC